MGSRQIATKCRPKNTSSRPGASIMDFTSMTDRSSISKRNPRRRTSMTSNGRDRRFDIRGIRASRGRCSRTSNICSFSMRRILKVRFITSCCSIFRLASYAARFNDLWLLSKQSFAENALDAYAERIGKKFQRVPISALLYKDLDECRELLTKSLAAWNKEKFTKNPTLLDEGVQKLLDRLIFIRVAEDRGVEPPTLIPLVREWEASKTKTKCRSTPR